MNIIMRTDGQGIKSWHTFLTIDGRHFVDGTTHTKEDGKEESIENFNLANTYIWGSFSENVKVDSIEEAIKSETPGKETQTEH